MPFFLLAALIILFLHPVQAATTKLCGIHIEGAVEISFSDTEKDWLCGSAKNPAWQDIPDSQRMLFLKGFLQSRGYHHVEFSRIDDSLNVKLGPSSQVQKLEIVNAPKEWDWKKRRHIIGRPFTPTSLNEINKWARRRLQEHGYICPRIESHGIIDDATFLLTIEPGPPSQFGPFTTIGEEQLDPAVLDRFSAFLPGEPFDIRLLELTSTRVLNEDLYLSTYFDITCQSDGQAKLIRRLIPAKPRLLTFGVGFDSEGGALLKSTYKHARMTDSADSMKTTLYTSFIEQTLDVKHSHYFSDNLSSRMHILSGAEIKRESETSYEAITYRLGSALALGWEFPSFTSAAKVGPYVTRTDTIRGPEPYRVDYLYLGAEVSMTSHLFEYYLADPKSGWTVTLNTSTQVEGALSQEDLHRITLNHQVLWNIQNWDPPLLILGWRGSLGTFILPEGFTSSDEIPINLRFFLGGDADLRGFDRKQLPESGAGYLTYIYQGLELRLGEVLRYNIQPLVFIDAAKASETAMDLSQEFYYSPGIGVRWGSPIGSVRATLARGYVVTPEESDMDPGYQFFFSFGREF